MIKRKGAVPGGGRFRSEQGGSVIVFATARGVDAVALEEYLYNQALEYFKEVECNEQSASSDSVPGSDGSQGPATGSD